MCQRGRYLQVLGICFYKYRRVAKNHFSCILFFSLARQMLAGSHFETPSTLLASLALPYYFPSGPFHSTHPPQQGPFQNISYQSHMVIVLVRTSIPTKHLSPHDTWWATPAVIAVPPKWLMVGGRGAKSTQVHAKSKVIADNWPWGQARRLDIPTSKTTGARAELNQLYKGKALPTSTTTAAEAGHCSHLGWGPAPTNSMSTAVPTQLQQDTSIPCRWKPWCIWFWWSRGIELQGSTKFLFHKVTIFKTRRNSCLPSMYKTNTESKTKWVDRRICSKIKAKTKPQQKS